MAKTPKQRAASSTTRRKTVSPRTVPKSTRMLRALGSLVLIAPHAHTGKRLHHRHTSHGVLFLALVLTGVLLFSNLGALKAFGITKAGSVNLSVNVLGAPPSVGADITFPGASSTTTYGFVAVQGTCPDQTLVVIYNNASFAGSTVCAGGLFSLTVPLHTGTNILQAQNYDGLDQPGPATSPITVIKEADEPVTPTEPGTPEPTPTNPAA